MPPDSHKHASFLYSKFGRGIAIFLKDPTSLRNSYPETLDVTKASYSFRKMWIAVICHSRIAKIISMHLAIRSTGIMNFNTIGIPVQAHRSICTFISAMQDGISHQLLQCHERIILFQIQ